MCCAVPFVPIASRRYLPVDYCNPCWELNHKMDSMANHVRLWVHPRVQRKEDMRQELLQALRKRNRQRKNRRERKRADAAAAKLWVVCWDHDGHQYYHHTVSGACGVLAPVCFFFNAFCRLSHAQGGLECLSVCVCPCIDEGVCVVLRACVRMWVCRCRRRCRCQCQCVGTLQTRASGTRPRF